MDAITAGVLVVAIVVPITVVGLVTLGHKEALSKFVETLTRPASLTQTDRSRSIGESQKKTTIDADTPLLDDEPVGEVKL